MPRKNAPAKAPARPRKQPKLTPAGQEQLHVLGVPVTACPICYIGRPIPPDYGHAVCERHSIVPGRRAAPADYGHAEALVMAGKYDRASGAAECIVCTYPLSKHPTIASLDQLVVDCTGRIWKT